MLSASMKRVRVVLTCVLLCIAVLDLSVSAGGVDAPPRLVVVIVVDQLPAELFERISPLFSGGFREFVDGGVKYQNAKHDHALTQTGPGHFALMSGRYPGPAGVPANEYYDRTRRRILYSIEDTAARIIGGDKTSASYRIVDATALGDWMKAARPGSRVYTVAGKDRAAILLGGKHPDGAFWFDKAAGGFTSNTYYMDGLPDFVRRFNARNDADRLIHRRWDRMLPDAKLYEMFAGPDSAPGEVIVFDGETAPVFPHVPLAARESTSDLTDYGPMFDFPWMDEFTLDMAGAVARRCNLGKDRDPDLLCVSLSAFDPIQHHYGSRSQESMDALLRMDVAVGKFMMTVRRVAGSKNVMFVLVSDHGSQPLPEWMQSRGVPARRAGNDVREFRERLLQSFRAKYRDADSLFLFRGRENFHFDHAELAQRRIPISEVYGMVRNLAAGEDWIAQVFDREELMSDAKLGVVGDRMRHSFHPVTGADIYLIPNPYVITAGGEFTRRGTNHGTPYDYDAHVPMIFLRPGQESETVSRPVRTVDVAPTIAEILGVTFPAAVNGVSLAELRVR